MKHHTLDYSCLLSTAQENVCKFHIDTNNLPLITPPWINVTIISMDDPMIEKSMVVLDIRRYGITTRWEMQIEKLDCPSTITDLMIKGPFPFFRHERRFTAITADTTLMNETITMALPLGWLGALAFPLIKRDMDSMFAYRHQATQTYFDKEVV